MKAKSTHFNDVSTETLKSVLKFFEHYFLLNEERLTNARAANEPADMERFTQTRDRLLEIAAECEEELAKRTEQP